MVGHQSSDPFSVEPLQPSPAVQNAFGNNGGSTTGQAQGMLGNVSHASTAGGQAVTSNGGGTAQASAQASSAQASAQASNAQASAQASSAQAQGPLGNSGQASGIGQSTTGVSGTNGGLGQASGPPGTLGTDGGLGQTVVSGGGPSVVSNLPPISHAADPSLIPLVAEIGAAAVGSGIYAAATSSRHSSRPSTGSSSQVLGPLVTPATPQGSYPSALQNWNASRGYGQAQAGPSTFPNNYGNDAPRPSFGSVASTGSAYSTSSLIGDSSGPPNLPSMGASSQYQQQHHRHTSSFSDSGGSGGPPNLPSMGASSQYQQHHRHTSSFGRVASLQVANNTDYGYQPYAEAGSPSFSRSVSAGAGIGGGSSSSSSPRQQQQQQQAPLYDGKGRPVDMPPEKAPLVHLDGGLYQEPPSRNPNSANEPPAYIE